MILRIVLIWANRTSLTVYLYRACLHVDPFDEDNNTLPRRLGTHSLRFYDGLYSKSATVRTGVFVLGDVLILFYCLIGFIVTYVALTSQGSFIVSLGHVMQIALVRITQLHKKRRAMETAITLI